MQSNNLATTTPDPTHILYDILSPCVVAVQRHRQDILTAETNGHGKTPRLSTTETQFRIALPSMILLVVNLNHQMSFVHNCCSYH